MQIINQTPEIAVLNTNGEYSIELGDMKKNTTKTATFLIEGGEYNSHRVSCGSCTKVNGNGSVFNISYTALGTKGATSKTATVILKDGKQLVFKIHAKII